MSLDVTLYLDLCSTHPNEQSEYKEFYADAFYDRAKSRWMINAFSANITHNLTAMADFIGVYEFLWRPEEAGVIYANQLIYPLERALEKLQTYPIDQFRKLEPENKWGTYEGLLRFITEYLEACKKYPEAFVMADR
jgi:hypothetical protein